MLTFATYLENALLLLCMGTFLNLFTWISLADVPAVDINVNKLNIEFTLLILWLFLSRTVATRPLDGGRGSSLYQLRAVKTCFIGSESKDN